ncbi:MAG: DUF3575 domain-containing protein [Dysgonamonadaceae bacterium]|nr:DUF3575 domain-containing protein [Dysgonamonadaceae bacterium]
MKFFKKNFITLFLFLSTFGLIQAQGISPIVSNHGDTYIEHVIITPPKWVIKSNLLYGATGTFNLGVEFRTGARTSLDLPFSWNPWEFSDTRQWRHLLAQPEFRFWTRETFRGHFFGLHGHYAYYNVGGLPEPFSTHMQNHRFEGWLAGAGLSYGYRWNFNHRWAMEATIGAGYAYLSYDKYECGDCGAHLGEVAKNYFGPTKVGLSLIYGIGGSRTTERTLVPPPPPIIIYYPTFVSSFITPPLEDPKIRNEVGSVYLEFVVDRSDILPNFRNNAAELQRMHTQLEEVLRDPDSEIRSINIVGHASIEGTYAHNLALTQRRATSLKDHVRTIHNLPDNLFTVRGAGEDWATLDSLVAQSTMPERFQLLEIIRSSDTHDDRERRLMQLDGGRPWRSLMDNLFPYLRRADYTLNFVVLPFTVEKGKEVFKVRPSNLSLNEMFLISETYTPRSPEYTELFEAAARLFPDSDVANLNAAAAALDRGETALAATYLGRVKEHSPIYWNNMGILQYFQSNKTEAAESFRRAGATGAGNAEALNRHFQSLQPR